MLVPSAATARVRLGRDARGVSAASPAAAASASSASPSGAAAGGGRAPRRPRRRRRARELGVEAVAAQRVEARWSLAREDERAAGHDARAADVDGPVRDAAARARERRAHRAQPRRAAAVAALGLPGARLRAPSRSLWRPLSRARPQALVEADLELGGARGVQIPGDASTSSNVQWWSWKTPSRALAKKAARPSVAAAAAARGGRAVRVLTALAPRERRPRSTNQRRCQGA